MRASNIKLVRLELFILTLSMASARLPRYVQALELHATLAERSSLPEDEVALLRLAAEALGAQLGVLTSVKSEAKDLAKKLD